MDAAEKVRENRLRRMAYRRGYGFVKSRLRDPEAVGYGRVHVTARDGGEAPGFESGDGLGLTLDEVERRFGDGEWARYRLYAANGTLLYVGSSNNPAGRFSTLSFTQWWPDVARKDVAWYPSEREARDAEAQSVVSEKPAHNVRLRSSDLTETVAVRMNEQELAELDEARGQASRSEWLRRILLGAEPRTSAVHSIATLPPPAAAGCQAHNPKDIRQHLWFDVSEAEEAAIDTARGDISRSEWLRGVVLSAAVESAKEPVTKTPAEHRRPVRRPQRGWKSRPVPAASAEPETGPCPHPKSARLKGRCTRCRSFVGY